MTDSIKVLLVEDNPADARLVQAALSRKVPVSMKTVDRLGDALHELRGNGIDVVLLDLSLPDSAGLNTFLELRRHSAIPTVILTGLQDESVGLRALQAGAQDYLVKGQIDPSLLARAVRYAIERDRAERSHTAMAERLRSLLESTTEGICAVDTRGDCVLINRAAQEMLGYDAEEIVGRNMHALVHMRHPSGSSYPEENCPFLQPLRSGEPSKGSDEVVWRRDGTSFPVDYSAAPTRADGHINGVVVTFNDITDRRLLQKQLEQERRVSSLGRLAATIAHEFNNVLMGIQTFTEVIERNAENPKAARAAQQIRKSVERGSQISREILRFTRPAEPVLRPLCIAAWLEEILPEIRSLVRPLISVKAEVADPTLSVYGDSGQLTQSLINLATNARDAMPAGGQLQIRVSLPEKEFASLVDPGGFVQISVSDTGSGMSPGVLEHVFEPLFTSKQGGTGLGLAVVHQIVLQHGGKIVPESLPGNGTTFHILLRRSPDAQPESSGRAPERRASLPPGVRILLVEDDPNVSTGIEALLEAEQAIVQVACSGAEAEQKAASFRPDVIMLDVGLPDIDGLELYRRLHAADPRRPIILSSGHGDMTRIQEMLGSEGVDFLPKPFSSADLFEVLSRRLR